MMNRMRHMDSAGSAPAATDPARSEAGSGGNDQRRERRGKRRR